MQISPTVLPNAVNPNLGIFLLTARTLPVRTDISNGGGTPASPVRSKAPQGAGQGGYEGRRLGALSEMFVRAGA